MWCTWEGLLHSRENRLVIGMDTGSLNITMSSEETNQPTSRWYAYFFNFKKRET